MTGHEYRGINTWMLMSAEFASPYFLTYRQALQLGGYVRRGQTGMPVVYWKIGTREVQDGGESIVRKSVLCRYYTVFSTEQCDGLRVTVESETSDDPPLPPIEACEQVVAEWLDKPDIVYGGECASYDQRTDCVRMPDRELFESPDAIYATLFHELTHSTGHPDRLDRATLTQFERFGDQSYSREELVAEMGAAYLCGFCGIENRTIGNSAAYLANWLETLKGDTRMVLIAAGQAQRAVDLILGRTAAAE